MGTSKAAILLALALTPSFKAEAQTAGLVSVSFPTSGAPKARPAFLRGLALLHSFEYEDFQLEGYQAHPHIKAPVAV